MYFRKRHDYYTRPARRQPPTENSALQGINQMEYFSCRFHAVYGSAYYAHFQQYSSALLSRQVFSFCLTAYIDIPTYLRDLYLRFLSLEEYALAGQTCRVRCYESGLGPGVGWCGVVLRCWLVPGPGRGRGWGRGEK